MVAIVAMTAYPEPWQSDLTYRPEKLQGFLRLYPYLALSHPPSDPEFHRILRTMPGGWYEEALAKRGDIARALDHLARIDERAELAVRLYYCVGLPLREVGDALRARYGVGSHETVRRWVEDSLDVMASYLGWVKPGEKAEVE